MENCRNMDELLERYPQLAVCKETMMQAFSLLSHCFRDNGKLLICGNGGSAADAEHIVGELMKGFKSPRKLDCECQEKLKDIDKTLGGRLAEHLQKALPAIALDGHPALSTAYMNDCEPLMCFAQQVNGYGREVIGLTGAKNSRLSEMADVCIQVPETETYKVQELHLPVYHCLCLMLEEEFFGIK